MLQPPAIYCGCKPKGGSRTYSTDSAAFADQNDLFAQSGRRGRGDLHALALDQCLDIPVIELLLAALGFEELHQHIRQGGFCAVEVDLIVEVGVLDGNTAFRTETSHSPDLERQAVHRAGLLVLSLRSFAGAAGGFDV